MQRRLALVLAALATPAAAQGLSPEQRAEVLDILRRALREDPSILRDAVAAMEAEEQRRQVEAASAAIVRHEAALFRDAGDPVRGNPAGRVTIVEFFDIRCPYCKQLHAVMEQLVARERDVRVALKDLPILGPNSLIAARALQAAHRVGGHGPLFDALMRLREEPTEAVIRREAERARLDWARIRREMDAPEVAERIGRSMGLARALEIQGTPAVVAGRALVPGFVELAQLTRLVAEARGR